MAGAAGGSTAQTQLPNPTTMPVAQPTASGSIGSTQPSSGFNVNTAAAQGMQQGMQGVQAGMAGTAQGMNYYSPMYAKAYMNPYEKTVIQGLQKDAQTNYQMGANQLGAEATAAGAFGGSRHGVAQGVMAGNVQNELNKQIGDLRYQGYNQAQQQALADQQMRLGASSQMGNLGTALGGMGMQAFDMGQQATANLQNVGLQQQAIQQALIDAAKGQYAGYTGAPATALGYLAQALGASPTPTTTTETKQPGLFDYLTAAAAAAS